ncbi:MAG TPA: apolipoprotein N-acyltransferase, partial [Chromatiales bacterium]|nr:apolipoprotein N-acyltransferase [Chromatiales bacterium]
MSARGDGPGGNRRRGRPGAAARGDLLALGAGAILPLAFAPIDWFPVTFLSLAGLFLLWREVGPRRALWRGWLFGVGMFGVGASWVFVSIHRYGNASVVLAALLTALFVVLLAGFPAVAGGLARRFGTGTVGLALGFPAWWMLIEWLREWFLTGFPWLSVGYSQLDAPLGALAPVAGVYGVGAAAALTAGCTAAALTAPGRRRVLPMLVIVALWGASWGLGWVTWTRPVGAPLPVSLVQGNVPQDLKWRPDRLDSILERYAGLTARHWDSRLIVWPET